jgi:archaellum component FlaC
MIENLYTIELIILAVAVYLQFMAFFSTIKDIKQIKLLFPEVTALSIDIPIDKQNINVMKKKEIPLSKGFTKVVLKINSFLDNTKGSTEGSMGIFSNLIKREKIKLEDKIESQLSAPLYIGLGGTLVGIVFGVFHLVTATKNADIAELNNEAINGLFLAVGSAVIVSLIGLILVSVNSNYIYKTAKVACDNKEADILSFLEIDLLPYVSESSASAIYSLRENLTQFNKEFGRNLDVYKTNFGLINENLKNQERVLTLLSKNNLAETAKEIANMLSDIDSVAKNFKVFKDYQVQLINSFEQTKEVSTQFNATLDSFSDFNTKLDNMASFIELQTSFNKQFQEFLSNNFPESESAREIYSTQWREIGNKLIHDIGNNSKHITSYFETVNNEVNKFASNNSSFFESFSGFRHAIEVLIKNSEMSYKAFDTTSKNMRSMGDAIKDQGNSISELVKTVKSNNLN